MLAFSPLAKKNPHIMIQRAVLQRVHSDLHRLDHKNEGVLQ